MKNALLIGFGTVLLVGCLVFLSVAVLMFFWNLVMHGIFGLMELSFLQTFGLYMLLWIIGSFFKGGSK